MDHKHLAPEADINPISPAQSHAALVGTLATTSDDRIIGLDTAFLSMTGYTAEALLSRRLQELLEAVDCVPADGEPDCPPQTTGFLRDASLDLIRADGSRLPVRLNAARHRGGGDNAVCNHVTVIDNTEGRWNEIALRRQRDHAQQAAEALRQSNRALEEQLAQAVHDRTRAEQALHTAQRLETLGHLAGGMAHDFNNVLQAVMVIASMLKRHANDPERVNRHARMLDKAAGRGTAITGRLLAYGRRGEPGGVLIDPAILLSQLRENLLPTMPDLTIELQIGPDVPPLYVDRNQFEIMLINLATNARDAMADRDGVLTLSAHWAATVPDRAEITSPQGFVRVAVRDTGTGMDANTLNRATEPFFTTKPLGKGTGLGLALASRFCHQTGGVMLMDSDVGIGTTITLYLPAAERISPGNVTKNVIRAEPTAAAATIFASQTSPEPARLMGQAPARFAIPGPVAMLAEAEPVIRDAFRAGLLAHGFRVIDVAQMDAINPETAQFNRSGGPAPDLLVAGLSEHDTDGNARRPTSAFDLIRAWRQCIPGLPALLVSHQPPDPTTAEWRQAEADGPLAVLAQPVAPAELAAAAAHILSARQRSDQCITSPPFGDKVAPT